MAATMTAIRSPERNMSSPFTFTGSSTMNNSRRSARKKTPNSKFADSEAPSNTPSTTASTPSPVANKTVSSACAASAKVEFYAIRQGRGVSHCIFPTWDHAKLHVEGFQGAVYNVFDNMDDAMLYIQVAASADEQKGENIKRKRTAMLPFSSTTNTTVQTKKARPGAAMKPTMSASEAVLPTSVSSSPVPTSSFRKSEQVCDKENVSRSQYAFVEKPKKKQQVESATPMDDIQEDTRDLPEILEDGYTNCRPKGWRANDLFPARRQDRFQWEARYLKDVATLKAYRAAKPTNARDVHNMRHMSGIPNAFSLAYLNWSWGVGEAYHRYLAFQQRKTKPAGTKLRTTKNNKLKHTPANMSSHYSCNTCVITNRDAARKRFSARAMFYSFRVQQLSEGKAVGLPKGQVPTRPDPSDSLQHNRSPLVNGCSRSKELMDEARADWDLLSEEDKRYWYEQEREHDARQPEIQRILEEALAKDPKRSAKKLSEDIGFWCGKTTIGKWKNLRIGPSYRKGIQVPVSRQSQQEHMLATKNNGSATTGRTGNDAMTTLLAAVSDISEKNYYRSSQAQTATAKLHQVELPEVSEIEESVADNVSSGSFPTTSDMMEVSLEDENLII